MSTVRFLAAFSTLALVLIASVARSADAQSTLQRPTYIAEECCTLCPRAGDPKTYVTSYLLDNRFLKAGHDGVIYRSEVDLRTDFAPEEDEVFNDIDRIGRALRARGITPAIVVVPPRGRALADALLPAEAAQYDAVAANQAYTDILGRFRAMGYIVPDMSRLYNEPLPNGEHVFFRRDGHWTPTAARRAAQLVVEEVKKYPIYNDIPHKEVTTKQSGLTRVGGAISLVAAGICGGYYPEEVVPKYETLVAASSDDLLGDTTFPSITLVGTSMSANPNYHFYGWLQTEFQADILNVAKSGGSIDGAMTEYLTSEAFLKNPPKLLIWEFVVQQLTLVRHSTMQRLVPRVGNGCVDSKLLLDNNVTIAPGQDHVEVLYNGGEKLFETPSKDLVVDMQFSDPTISEVSTEGWFLNGKVSPLRLRYNEFTDAKGRFVFEFSHHPEYASQPLTTLRVQIGSTIAGPAKLRVQLCTGDPS